MKKSIAVIIFIILTLKVSNAFDISGTIKDSKTNELLVGTSVYISELKIGTLTGLDGSFRLKNVPKGKYILQVSFIGYQTIEKEISVKMMIK